jgi:hypothetical protein
VGELLALERVGDVNGVGDNQDHQENYEVETHEVELGHQKVYEVLLYRKVAEESQELLEDAVGPPEIDHFLVEYKSAELEVVQADSDEIYGELVFIALLLE